MEKLKGTQPSPQEHIAIDIVLIIQRIQELQKTPYFIRKKHEVITLVAQELADMLLGTGDEKILFTLIQSVASKLNKKVD